MSLIKNNTGLLIRFDDIAENMNWELMDRCEMLLKKWNYRYFGFDVQAGDESSSTIGPRNVVKTMEISTFRL